MHGQKTPDSVLFIEYDQFRSIVIRTQDDSLYVPLTSVSTRHSLILNMKEYVKVLLCTKVPIIRNVPFFSSLSFW